MCGISGIIYSDRERLVEKSILVRMTDTLNHRGPDGEGYFIDRSVALGHRRLAIIDLETGQQPLISRDGKLALVFNGEIYNYLELREQLKGSGHLFTTNSDTEVLLRAYEEWGLEFHHKLNGMWAFALWDGRRDELILSRDRLGEKPLYYAEWDGGFIFGSEIKSLLACGLPPEANPEVLDLYLTFKYVPAPHTFYKRVKKLEPGHFLIIKDGQAQRHKYWNLPTREESQLNKNEGAIEEEFEYLLRDSVRLRMRSDVAYGAFLSGGLDSPSVVALMAEASRFPVETFTVGFDEKEFDERMLARQVASQFRTSHHEGTVTPDTFEENLTKVLQHCDEPFGDSSAIPTGQIARYARAKVKMLLTGDGGDEVLSGYNSYQSEKLAGTLSSVPRPVVTASGALLKGASRLMAGDSRFKFQRLAQIADTMVDGFEERLVRKAAQMAQEKRNRVLAPLLGQVIPAREFLMTAMQSCPYKDSFYRMVYFDFTVSLPDDMLVKVDRMTMAHSLEARVPFLDHRLVELMAVVHKKVKMRGFQRKSVLRNTIARRLPPALLKSPKRGFMIPVREWFKGNDLRGELTNLIAAAPLGMDFRPLQQIIEENNAGAADWGNLLWMCFLLDRWAKRVSAN